MEWNSPISGPCTLLLPLIVSDCSKTPSTLRESWLTVSEAKWVERWQQNKTINDGSRIKKPKYSAGIYITFNLTQPDIQDFTVYNAQVPSVFNSCQIRQLLSNKFLSQLGWETRKTKGGLWPTLLCHLSLSFTTCTMLQGVKCPGLTRQQHPGMKH